jgi:hypothetical protein
MASSAEHKTDYLEGEANQGHTFCTRHHPVEPTVSAAIIQGGILDIPVSNITFPAPSVRGEPAHLVNTILTKHNNTEDSKDLIQHAADLIEPATFRQDQLSPQSEQWQSAMDAELASLEDKHVMTIIPENELPKDCKPLSTKWVYKTKKQSVVSTSSCEAEYMAASSTVKDSLYILNLLKEMITVQLPVKL